MQCPPFDEGQRGHLAVAISLLENNDDYIFFFDDLHLLNCGEKRMWEHKKFVTSAVVLKEKLATLSFSDEEAAGLGHTIIGSLKAMYIDSRKRR